MYSYYLDEWLLFFFIYCFAGWIWESCYVSICEKHWVNRGFMHGPLLPIYGSGAVIILAATLEVKEQPALVFLFGMIAATLLEYVTGAVMERLFQVRYWDYTGNFLNLNGYICFKSSLAWGAFSMLMVYGIHKPVEWFAQMIPKGVVEGIVFLITIAFVVDFTQSFNEAMDLKKTLQKLTESNEKLLELNRKLVKITEVAEDGIKEVKEKAETKKELLEQRILLEMEKSSVMFENVREKYEKCEKIWEFNKEAKKQQFTHSLRLLKRNPTSVSLKYKNALKEIEIYMQELRNQEKENTQK